MSLVDVIEIILVVSLFLIALFFLIKGFPDTLGNVINSL